MTRPETVKNRRTLLRDAQRYVQRHLGAFDLSLAEVAAAISTSPRQLQRVFQEEGDEDFRAYLLRVRMTRARALLTREPNPLPVRAVCHRVGYRQPSGLRQAFLRYYGVNPSEVQAPALEYLGTTTFEETPREPRDDVVDGARFAKSGRDRWSSPPAMPRGVLSYVSPAALLKGRIASTTRGRTGLTTRNSAPATATVPRSVAASRST